MLKALLNVGLIALAVILIALLTLFCVYFYQKKIFPKYCVAKHRIAYDYTDNILHTYIIEYLKPHRICKIDYTENEFNCAVLTFWCPKWQSKKILKDLRQLKEVEVI